MRFPLFIARAVGFAAIAAVPLSGLFAAGSPSTDAPSDAPARYGVVLYHTPPGWTAKETPAGVTLTPPEAGATLLILPPREFPYWRAYFDAIQKPASGERLVGRVPLTVKHDANGFDELYAGQILKNQKGIQFFEWYGAAHRGRVVQALYFRAQGLDRYRALHAAVDRFINTLQFETPPADESSHTQAAGTPQ